MTTEERDAVIAREKVQLARAVIDQLDVCVGSSFGGPAPIITDEAHAEMRRVLRGWDAALGSVVSIRKPRSDKA